MHRTGRNRREGIKLAAYVAAGTISGLLAGAALGALGGLFPASMRAGLAVLAGVLAVGIGGMGLRGVRLRMPQVDHETPYNWLRPGPIRWAIRNGATLGIGVMSRLGFWLWYVIPVGSLLSGSPMVGAIGYGLYGFTRTISAGGIMLIGRKHRDPANVVFGFSSRARRLANIQLLAMGLCLLIFAGL